MPIRNTTPVQETIKINLAEFKEKMSPSAPVDNAVRANQQLRLLSTIRMIFRQEGEEFKYCFGMLERWVAENINGCMSIRRRFVGLEYAKTMDSKDMSGLTVVINLLCMIANKESRNLVLKRFDFGRLNRFWPDNASGDKLTEYFSNL